LSTALLANKAGKALASAPMWPTLPAIANRCMSGGGHWVFPKLDEKAGRALKWLLRCSSNSVEIVGLAGWAVLWCPAPHFLYHQKLKTVPGKCGEQGTSLP
jgi:hypothetical protein